MCAKIKYSALVSDMRNKLNGSVLSKNRYGSFIRNKVTPTNPQTAFQQKARQSLGNLSSSYRELTAGQIASWNQSGVNFPFTDIFGDIKHLSGQTLFVKLNANLEKVGSPRISQPPLPVGFPELAIDTFEVEVDDLDNTDASFAVTPELIPAGYKLVVYATPGLSRAVQFVRNRFRFLGAFDANAGVVSIGNALNERFGQPLVDEVVHIRVAMVSTETGQQGVPVMISGTVAQMP